MTPFGTTILAIPIYWGLSSISRNNPISFADEILKLLNDSDLLVDQ